MRIRHLMVGVTVVAGGLLLSACDWEEFGGQEFSDSESLSGSVSEVRFANDSGNVKITAGDKLEVRRTVGYHETKPGKTYRVDGDVLVLENCPERGCWVGYEVTVPADVKVSGHVDSGDAEIAGVASVNVEADSGNVTIRDVDGAVNAKADSGNVELSGIGGAVVAGAESGNVSVALDEPDGVTVTTSSGNIDVTVPKGDYQVEIQGDDVTNNLGNGTSGPSIDLNADSGNVTLTPA
jgi:hypothetical protein